MKYVITLGSKQYEVEVEESEVILSGVTEAPAAAAPASAAPVAQMPAPAAQSAVPAAVAAEGIVIAAPMPGTILSVNVALGDAVKAGQVLAVLEAMKMENEISAPSDGVVKQILTTKGAAVDTDDALVVI
ncbi:MAG: biotin/lipoyl-binding protein [Oscillospiraceae bacterium]|jgi:glutaconyl-CoA decarboxylase|nr:biotin/lipoyl-binding protein [Oscillospiraceae bacterium]